MVFTSATPYTRVGFPFSNITPFTYADGTTYLEQLEDMRCFLNETMVPEINSAKDFMLSFPDDTIAAILAEPLGLSRAALNAGWVPWINGHIGIEKSNPQNARLYIGSGTGTLPDNGNSGLKVKVDTTIGTRNDAIAGNVNLIAGSGDGQTRAIIGRIDVNDTAVGDTVGGWFDTMVHSASSRNTWGINTYVQIDAASGYLGTAVGAEIAVMNNGLLAQGGGLLHLVAGGSSSVRFGLKIGGSTGTTNIQHNILLSSTTPPLENAFYYGPLASGNNTTGTPLFQLDAGGRVGIGMLAAAGVGDLLSVAGSIRIGESGRAVRFIPGSGTPEGVVSASVGSLYFNVDPGVVATRVYVKSTGTGSTNTGWVAI